MITLLTQAASNADIGTYLQNIFQQAIGIDVMLAFRLLGLWIFIIWLVFALWVAIDASARYRQWQIAVLWFLFVLPFNILGFIGYLFMRPAVTIDEHQWTKLESKYLMHELSNVNDCPTCGTLVPITHNFCPVCGTSMNVVCSKCESVQSIYNVHCTNCGEKLGEEQRITSNLVIKPHRVNLLQKIGESILTVQDTVKAKATSLSESRKAKKKLKQEARAAKKAAAQAKKEQAQKAQTEGKDSTETAAT